MEITECGANLCGRAVWIKDPKDSKGCGIQIIGNAKPVAGGKWDNGWIYDPDEDAKYSVELTPLAGDKLKVLGYSGSKFFSETMIWKRAPADLKRCDQTAAVTPAVPVTAEKSDAQTDAKTVAAAPPVVVPEEKTQNASAVRRCNRRRQPQTRWRRSRLAARSARRTASSRSPTSSSNFPANGRRRGHLPAAAIRRGARRVLPHCCRVACSLARGLTQPI